MARTQIRNKARFIEALTRVKVISVACKITEIGRSTIYEWEEKDHKFKLDLEKAQSRGQDNLNDLCEITVINSVKAGNISSAKWMLEKHHKDYIPKPKEERDRERLDNMPLSDYAKNVLNKALNGGDYEVEM